MNIDQSESIIFSSEYMAKHFLDKGECEHYWVHGYIGEPIVFCNKCNIDLGNLFGLDMYKNFTCNDNGKIVTLDEYYKVKKNKTFIQRLKTALKLGI